MCVCISQLRCTVSIVQCHHLSCTVPTACFPGDGDSWFMLSWISTLGIVEHWQPLVKNKCLIWMKRVLWGFFLKSILFNIRRELKFDTVILFLICPWNAETQGLSLRGRQRLLLTSTQRRLSLHCQPKKGSIYLRTYLPTRHPGKIYV